MVKQLRPAPANITEKQLLEGLAFLQKTKLSEVHESDIIGLDRVRWAGAWAPGDYAENDMTRDGAWTTVANQDTNERPAPQPYGDPFHVYTGILSPENMSAKAAVFGNRYSFSEGGYLLGYRVETVAGNHYTVYAVLDPLGTPIFNQVADFTATDTGWFELNTLPSIIFAGTVLDLVALVSEPDPTPTVFSGNWNYTKPNNNGAPASGQILHSNRELALFNVHKTDNDAGDRSAELGALTVGDIIDGAAQRWSIQSITDNGAYFTFGVAPAAQGSPTGVQNFDFETVTATPITYGRDEDYWLGNADVDGLFIADGDYADIVPNDDAYGTDLLIQGATVSEHWDLVALSGASGVGGGAGSFPQIYETDPLAAPITVTEGGPPTALVTLAIPTPIIGKYRVSINLICDFTSANDQLTWRTTGSFPSSSDFLIEAKDANERVPFYYELTIPLDGSAINTVLEAEVTGAGAADVVVDTAAFFLQRVG